MIYILSDMGKTPPRIINSRTALGLLLRDARGRNRLSQEQLARKVGLTQATISAIERGLRDLKLDTLLSILAALGLELLLRPRGQEDPLRMWEEG